MSLDRIKMTNRALSRLAGEYYVQMDTSQDADLIEIDDVLKNIEKLVVIYAKQIDDLEVAFQQVYLSRWINTASGYQLDVIGKLLDQSRILDDGERLSDEDYKLFLRAKATRNTSSATPEEVSEQAKLILNTDDNVRIKTLGSGRAEISFSSELTAQEKLYLKDNDLLPRATGVEYIFTTVTDSAFSMVNEDSPNILPISNGGGFIDENDGSPSVHLFATEF